MAAIRLEHVGIPAKGDAFEQTIVFYETVFGWKRIKEISGNSRLCFISDSQGGILEILDVDGPRIPNPAHLAFAVSLTDFDAALERATAAGVAFEPTTISGTGDSLAYFHDPAGNRAQLVGRKSPLE